MYIKLQNFQKNFISKFHEDMSDPSGKVGDDSMNLD